MYTFWREKAASVHAATGANMTFTLQPIPANLVEQGNKKGGNPLGLPNIDHQCEFHLLVAVHETDVIAHYRCRRDEIVEVKDRCDQGDIRNSLEEADNNVFSVGWTTLVDWTNEKDDELVRSVAIGTAAKWKEFGEQRGSHIPFLDMNDASREQDPLSSYGKDNLEKLKAVARKYDPERLFQRLQGGGFLLKNAGEKGKEI